MQAAFAPLALGPAVADAARRCRPSASPRCAQGVRRDHGGPGLSGRGRKRSGLACNAPRTGEQIQAVMERACQSPPRVIDRLRQLNSMMPADENVPLHRGRPR